MTKLFAKQNILLISNNAFNYIQKFEVKILTIKKNKSQEQTDLMQFLWEKKY